MPLLADCKTRHKRQIFAIRKNKCISSRGDSRKDRKRNPCDLELLRKVKVFVMKRMPNEITRAIKTYELKNGILSLLKLLRVLTATGFRMEFFILDTLDTWPTCPPES